MIAKTPRGVCRCMSCSESHLELINRYANLQIAYNNLIERRKWLDSEIDRLERENALLKGEWLSRFEDVFDAWGWFDAL